MHTSRGVSHPLADSTLEPCCWHCLLQGEAPTGSQTSSITATLGAAATSSSMAFTNPFDRPVEVEVSLSSVEAPGTFTLLLPGAAAPAGAAADEPDAAWAGLDADADDADSSSAGGLLADAAGLLGAVAAAAVAEDQAKQPKQPRVQQVAHVTVAPGAVLEMPVSFAPQVLRQATAQLSVAVQPDPQVAAAAAREAEAREPERRLIAWGKDGPKSAPPVPPPAVNPLEWWYDVTGVARADAPGVKFAVSCVAKQKAELVIEVPLPGLDVEQAAAAAAAAAEAVGAPAAAAAGTSGALGGFRYSLLLPEDQRAALAAAVTLEPLDAVPAPSPSGSLRSSSCSSAAAPTGPAGASDAVAAAPVLRYLLRFAPLKALKAVAQLQVECGDGGACWMYDVTFAVGVPCCLTVTCASVGVRHAQVCLDSQALRAVSAAGTFSKPANPQTSTLNPLNEPGTLSVCTCLLSAGRCS